MLLDAVPSHLLWLFQMNLPAREGIEILSESYSLLGMLSWFLAFLFPFGWWSISESTLLCSVTAVVYSVRSHVVNQILVSLGRFCGVPSQEVIGPALAGLCSCKGETPLGGTGIFPSATHCELREGFLEVGDRRQHLVPYSL